jgi:GNAT superfamily N-acetyltransferase
MAHYIAESSRVYVVAYDAQDLAGFIALRDATRISQFFVEPRHQGKGLGRKLWNEVRLVAGATEDAEFTVDSSLNAVPVYEKFGFTVCGPVAEQGGVVFTPMHRPARADDA